MHKLLTLSSIITLLVFNSNAQQNPKNILSERGSFKTVLKTLPPEQETLEKPKSNLFSLVEYPTPIGKMKAYLSTVKDTKKKHAAIIWLTGGFPVGGAGSYVWEEADNENDQSAQVYRKNGMVMMYPSFRGYAGNPGKVEAYYGEVNDVLSALDYLSKLDYVDSKQIYLGGHSSGATLALLTACATDKFKAVFSFGATGDPADYGVETEKHTNSSPKERLLRAPINFLKYIKTPTFILGGEGSDSDSILEMQQVTKNKNIRFSVIKGADHFNVLWPINKLLAEKITKGTLDVEDSEMQVAFRSMVKFNREANDLQTLSYLRKNGVLFGNKQLAQYYLISRKIGELKELKAVYDTDKVKTRAIATYKDSKGVPYYILIVEKEITPINLQSVFSKSAGMDATCKAMGIIYDGWTIEH